MRLFVTTASIITAVCVAPVCAQPANPAGMPPGTPENAPGLPAPHQPNVPDRMFVQAAAIGGMAEVDLGRLAEQRGQIAAVKGFGQRMVEDHAQANEQLSKLAKAAGLMMPGGADAEARTMQSELMALHNSDFDRAYIREQIVAHQKTAQLLAYEIGSGQDPQLKAFAEKTLPVVLRHLSIAQAIDTELTGAAPPANAESQPHPIARESTGEGGGTTH